MRMRSAVLSIAIAASLVTGAEARSRGAESRIRTLIAEQVAAWNAGDAIAYSRSFADDGTFTNVRGTVFYGHQAFVDRHREIFGGFFKGSRIALTVSRIRFIRPDVAIVDIAAEVSELHGTPPGVKAGADGHLHTRLQEVWVQDRGTWRIASYHNVDVKE